MTDYINRDAFNFTLASYNEAMQDVFNISNHINPTSNRWQDPLPTEWRVDWNTQSREHFITHVTRISISVNDLLEYGRPKPHAAGISNFLRLTGYADFSFDRCRVCAPHAAMSEYVDDDGELQPARPYEPERIVSERRVIQLQLFEYNYGVKQYRSERDNLTGLMDEAPKKVRDEWAVALDRCDGILDKYNHAIKEVVEL